MPYGVILSLRRTAGALTLASLLLAALAALAARAEDAAPAAAPAPEAAAPDASSIAPQAVAPAASTCQTDFQRLMSRRMAGIQKLNALGKAGKGKMDPIAACPAARNLVGIEGEMLGYMIKNKDWCSIPDSVLEQFRAARGKTQNFASQACSVAAKVKKMQAMQKEQAAAGGGMMAPPKLPSGPL